jgi:hypothetical protein
MLIGLSPFLAEWELVLDRSRIAHGPRPKASVLLLQDLGNRLLVLMVWTGEDDKPVRVERSLFYDQPTIDEDSKVILQLADGALESTVYEGDVEVARARRVILPDGALEITQTSGEHTNVWVYKKLDERD